MTAKHTPGPWSYVGKSRIRSGNPRQPIATAFGSGRTHDERAANARLIAAAPDLLAALQAVDEMFSQPGKINSETVKRVVRAAIAKAVQS